MPLTVNVHDAKTQFSRLLEQAHSGQEIILAKTGKPYAPIAIEMTKGLNGVWAGDFIAQMEFAYETAPRYPRISVVVHRRS